MVYTLQIFSCISPCGTNHTIVRTERMRIFEIYIYHKKKKEKKLFWGPRATFDPARERLIGP